MQKCRVEALTVTHGLWSPDRTKLAHLLIAAILVLSISACSSSPVNPFESSSEALPSQRNASGTFFHRPTSPTTPAATFTALSDKSPGDDYADANDGGASNASHDPGDQPSRTNTNGAAGPSRSRLLRGPWLGLNLGNLPIFPFRSAPLEQSEEELRQLLKTAVNDLANAGGNLLRVWFHIDGSLSPCWGPAASWGAGQPPPLVAGCNDAAVEDLKWLLRECHRRGVRVLLVLWSHDLLAVRRDNPPAHRDRALHMLRTARGTAAYVDNCLTPLVRHLATTPLPGADDGGGGGDGVHGGDGSQDSGGGAGGGCLTCGGLYDTPAATPAGGGGGAAGQQPVSIRKLLAAVPSPLAESAAANTSRTKAPHPAALSKPSSRRSATATTATATATAAPASATSAARRAPSLSVKARPADTGPAAVGAPPAPSNAPAGTKGSHKTTNTTTTLPDVCDHQSTSWSQELGSVYCTCPACLTHGSNATAANTSTRGTFGPPCCPGQLAAAAAAAAAAARLSPFRATNVNMQLYDGRSGSENRTELTYSSVLLGYEVLNEPEGMSWDLRLYHNYMYDIAWGSYALEDPDWYGSRPERWSDFRTLQVLKALGGERSPHQSRTDLRQYRGWHFVGGNRGGSVSTIGQESDGGSGGGGGDVDTRGCLSGASLLSPSALPAPQPAASSSFNSSSEPTEGQSRRFAALLADVASYTERLESCPSVPNAAWYRHGGLAAEWERLAAAVAAAPPPNGTWSADSSTGDTPWFNRLMYIDVVGHANSELLYLMPLASSCRLRTTDVSVPQLQRFVSRLAATIHRADPRASVTVGAHSLPYCTEVLAGRIDEFERWPRNLYSDAALKRAFRLRSGATGPGWDPSGGGTLDFYAPHGYPHWGHDAVTALISPFKVPACGFKLDKPTLIGEFWDKVADNEDLTPALWSELHSKGCYMGGLGWAMLQVAEAPVFAQLGDGRQLSAPRRIVNHEKRAAYLSMLRKMSARGRR